MKKFKVFLFISLFMTSSAYTGCEECSYGYSGGSSDPCDYVSCPNMCSKDIKLYNGYCKVINGETYCYYSSETCQYGCLNGQCKANPWIQECINQGGCWDYGSQVCFPCGPDYVELVNFIATPRNKSIMINWETAVEIDNAGFNLYRAESEDGEYVKINSSLIPAKGSPTQGATYQFIDDGVKNRTTYYYKLEDIDLNGVSTLHGPVSATPRVIHNLR